MKKIILATLAAAALVACAKEDVVVAPKGEAIGFANAFIDNSVRSIDPSITNEGTNALQSFVVYGTTTAKAEDGGATVNIYPGVEVKKQAATDSYIGTQGWIYMGEYVQYWIKDNKYNFVAVVNGTVGTDDVDIYGMPKAINYTADGSKDLLYAEHETTGLASNNPAVAFTFSHLLSKAKVTVKNTITTNSDKQAYTYKVTGVKITNPYLSATYDVVNKAWDANKYTGKFETVFGDVNTAVTTDALEDETGAIKGGATAESYNERLLIPATYSALNIKATIELYLNNTKVDVINYDKNVANITLAKGIAYNFVISLGNPGEPIEFTVTNVNGWNSAANGIPAPGQQN